MATLHALNKLPTRRCSQQLSGRRRTVNWETNIERRLLVIVGALFLAGVILAGILYVTFPVQVTTYGGTARNYLLTLSTPTGTVSTEANPAYQTPVAAAPSPPAADAWPNAAVGDWPSYNRTPSSQRYSPLNEINTKNFGQLKVLAPGPGRRSPSISRMA